MSSQPRDNSSRDSVLASYLADLPHKENAASKGGEGAIGVPHTIMRSPAVSDCCDKYPGLSEFGRIARKMNAWKDEIVAVNSRLSGEKERCGPCTADCYENCGVWMPDGGEIREVWESRVGDMGKLD